MAVKMASITDCNLQCNDYTYQSTFEITDSRSFFVMKFHKKQLNYCCDFVNTQARYGPHNEFA